MHNSSSFTLPMETPPVYPPCREDRAFNNGHAVIRHFQPMDLIHNCEAVQVLRLAPT